MKKNKYQLTMYACFIGYIVQAIVNNFLPLLFVTFQKTYSIPLTQITLLITLNFGIQLVIDMLSAGFVDKIGYRASTIIAHVCSAAGLVLLTVLPEAFPDPFAGILIAVFIYAIGGGLIEVLISPILEACPTDNKEKAMSLLHSFYCWGHVGVVLISTLFFTLFGIENWKILAVCWAVVPAVNIILFAKAPIYSLHEEGETGLTLKQLFTRKVFWVMMLMMLCAGASEQAVSQWASTFAEKGLGVSKALGDLTGPTVFSLLMGLSRLIYGKRGDKMDLTKTMLGCCGLCVAAYLLIGLTQSPLTGLIGVGLCGFSVGIFWPGTFSTASASMHRGGTALFALMALAGDLGCSAGPTVAGAVASALGDNLRAGILCGLGFPLLMIVGVLLMKRMADRARPRA